MLKITLLKTLYYEFDHLLSRDGHHYEHRDKRFRTIHKTYPGIPEIASVTMEERYLPKSVLYYIWINDEKKEADLNDTKLCRWIFSFVKENCPDYLKNELPEDPIGKGISILDCFEVSHISDCRPILVSQKINQ